MTKPRTTLPATVEKVIKPLSKSEPEKVQIAVETAEELYREIRIEDKLTDQNGNEVLLKPGAEVQVTIEAEPDGTVPKEGKGSLRNTTDNSNHQDASKE